jgi:hypothetical protein
MTELSDRFNNAALAFRLQDGKLPARGFGSPCPTVGRAGSDSVTFAAVVRSQRARTDDRKRAVCRDPGDGDFSRRNSSVLGDGNQCVENSAAVRGVLLLEHPPAEPFAPTCLARAIFAGQHAAPKRRPCTMPRPSAWPAGKAPDRSCVRLGQKTGDGRNAAQSGDGCGPRRAPSGKVGEAGIENLAVPGEVILLGLPEPIAIGRIDEVSAGFGVGVEDATGLIGLRATPPARVPKVPSSRTSSETRTPCVYRKACIASRFFAVLTSIAIGASPSARLPAERRYWTVADVTSTNPRDRLPLTASRVFIAANMSAVFTQTGGYL